MTIDKSLRVRRGAVKNRGVLTRAERIQRLTAAEKFTDSTSPYGLPKVLVPKLSMKKKKKKKEEGDEAAATPAAAPAADKKGAEKKPADKKK